MKRIIAVASLTLLLGACSKDKSTDNSGTAANTITVSMKGSAFSPSNLQVGITTTVTWLNDDNMVHTVTSDKPGFDSGDIQPGGRFSFTFNSVGTYDYHCVHHPNMTGTVLVMAMK